MDLLDTSFFPDCDSRSEIVRSVKIPEFNDPHIENEVRGFLQYLVIERKYVASTMRGYIERFATPYSRFMNNNHPEASSISEFDFDKIYAEYLEFLSDQGLQLVSESIYRVDENMEWKTYSTKSGYVAEFVKFYRFIYETFYPDTRPEFEKDIWDIRKLGIPYNIAVCRKRYTVNYTSLYQDWLKKAAKKYNYYRIQNRTMSAVLDDMKALNLFSTFLYEQHTEISALDELNRQIIEEYFSYVSQRGFVTTTYNRRLSGLRTFLTIGNMLDLDRFPIKQLIFNSDYRKVPHCMPKYFTDKELEQMNAHISDLPIQIARMFFVLENCGMRVSDICSSPIMPNGKFCLSLNSEKEYIFTYYMPKSHRYNTIPITQVVGEVINEAINESRKCYGEDCIYIFATSAEGAISTETFSFHMNMMSKKHDLKRDDGTPLRIKGHTFRGTVATRYANCGINMDVIRMMLGQQKIGVLKHYVTIHEDTMLDYLKPITEENERMIRNIGCAELIDDATINEPALIPLPNGHCSKSVTTGICNHANRCYSCSMFRPSPCCLPIYRAQLQEAESNIAIAEIHGYERIIEINTKLRDDLKKIISKIEERN